MKKVLELWLMPLMLSGFFWVILGVVSLVNIIFFSPELLTASRVMISVAMIVGGTLLGGVGYLLGAPFITLNPFRIPLVHRLLVFGPLLILVLLILVPPAIPQYSLWRNIGIVITAVWIVASPFVFRAFRGIKAEDRH